MTTNASRKAVFETNELLEQIILCLPMKTIFGIQRVCRQFRDVIAASPKIQEKMFLRLRNIVPKEAWTLETSIATQAPWAEEARFRKADENTKGRLWRPAVLNPLFELTPIEEHLSSADRINSVTRRTETVEMLLSSSHFGDHPSFLKTFITDPPCYGASAEIVADFLLDPAKEDDVVVGTVSGNNVVIPRALTVGDVVRARTSVDLRWDESGLGDASYTDAQLEEVIGCIAPIDTGINSIPILTLQLWNLVIPTEEEWRAVSSQHVDVTS
jgi:hypothetical protein